MKPFHLIPVLIFTAIGFAIGYGTHAAQLANAGLGPEQIRAEFKDRDGLLEELKSNLDHAVLRNEVLADLQDQLKKKIVESAVVQKEMGETLAAYQERAENEFRRLGKIESAFLYRSDPATRDEVIAIKKHFSEIEAELSPKEFSSLKSSMPYQQLKALLNRLPHAAL